MPELPEVETIKNQLNKYIPKKMIKKIYQSGLKLHGKDVPDLNMLLNQEVLSINRRNKFIVIEFEIGFLLLHMGMTGQLIYANELPESQKHIHLVLNFEKDLIYFKDVRRFGIIDYFDKAEYSSYHDIPAIKKLGIEPLTPEFTQTYLNNLIKNNTQNAKSFVMDNSKICGIGNIYASEILFLSKIHPQQKVNLLTIQQKKDLHKNIIEVLNKAIEMGGSTISDFLHIDGTQGGMQNYYFVYGKTNTNENCKVCGTKIEKISQNGRYSFFCNSCQPLIEEVKKEKILKK